MAENTNATLNTALVNGYMLVVAEDYETRLAKVDELAAEHKVTRKSVIQRLTKAGVYKGKTAEKSTRVKKADKANALAAKLGKLGYQVSETEAEYLERLTVALIDKLDAAIGEVDTEADG